MFAPLLLLLLSVVPSYAGPDLDAEIKAFETKLDGAVAKPDYDLFRSVDMDRELEALEAKAGQDAKAREKLLALRVKLVPPPGSLMPKFARYRAPEAPALSSQLRWRQYVDLFSYCMDAGSRAFLEAHGANVNRQGDFIEAAGGKPLSTEAVVALWRDAQTQGLLASAEPAPAPAEDKPKEEPAPRGPKPSLADAAARLAKIEEGLQGTRADKQDAAAELGKLFDNMSKADLDQLAKEDPDAFAALVAQMQDLRGEVPESLQGWVDAPGGTARLDEKLARGELAETLGKAKAPARRKRRREAAADDGHWYDALRGDAQWRRVRAAQLESERAPALAALAAVDGPEAAALRTRLEGGAPDAASQERLLADAQRLLERSPKAVELRRLLENMGGPDGEAALQRFYAENGEFARAHAKFGEASAQYKVWLRRNAPLLPDGTMVDPGIVGLHPDTLPGLRTGGAVRKATRGVDGAPQAGFEYQGPDGRWRFSTAGVGANGEPMPVTLVFGDDGKLKARHLFMPPGPDGRSPALTESGRFDARGRLVDGFTHPGTEIDRTKPFEKVTVQTKPDGGSVRTRLVLPHDGVKASEALETITEAYDKDGRMTGRRSIKKDQASGKPIESVVGYGRDGRPDQLESRVLDENGKPLETSIWSLRDGRWTQYLENGSTRQQLVAGETALVPVDPAHPELGPAPKLVGPGIYRIQREGEAVSSVRVDLAALRDLPFAERRAALERFVRGPLFDELKLYQPRTAAPGFYGANELAANPGSMIGTLEQALDDAKGLGNPVLVLDTNASAYHIYSTDKNGATLGHFVARYGGAGDGRWGMQLYRVADVGGEQRYTLAGVMLDADHKELPSYQRRNRDTIFGMAVEGDSYVFGHFQDQRTDYVGSVRGPDGKWRDGETRAGTWETVYTKPGAGTVIWEAVPKAGESVVAGAGALVAGVGVSVTGIADWSTSRFGDAMADFNTLTGDNRAALSWRRWSSEDGALTRSRQDFERRVRANVRLNPLAQAYRNEDAVAAELATETPFYIMDAPNVMARQAAAADSWYGKAGWAAAGAFTNFGLQTGVGLASFGPLGSVGAGKNLIGAPGWMWRGMQTFNKVFEPTMQLMGVHGALESTYGKGGIVDAMSDWRTGKSPDAELKFYQSLNNWSANVMPYAVGYAHSKISNMGKAAPPEAPAPREGTLAEQYRARYAEEMARARQDFAARRDPVFGESGGPLRVEGVKPVGQETYPVGQARAAGRDVYLKTTSEHRPLSMLQNEAAVGGKAHEVYRSGELAPNVEVVRTRLRDVTMDASGKLPGLEGPGARPGETVTRPALVAESGKGRPLDAFAPNERIPAEDLAGLERSIKALHEKGVAHGDLSGANILAAPDPANPGHFKFTLFDFGLGALQDNPNFKAAKTGDLANLARIRARFAPESAAPASSGGGGLLARLLGRGGAAAPETGGPAKRGEATGGAQPRPLLSLEEYRGLLEQQTQNPGKPVPLENVPRPGLGGVADGVVQILQGAGRFEKLRAGESMDVFLPEGEPLPRGAVVLETGVPGELVRTANMLSSRGSDGANPTLLRGVKPEGRYRRVLVPREACEAPTSQVAGAAEASLEALKQWGVENARARPALDAYLDSAGFKDLSLLERNGILSRLEAAARSGPQALETALAAETGGASPRRGAGPSGSMGSGEPGAIAPKELLAQAVRAHNEGRQVGGAFSSDPVMAQANPGDCQVHALFNLPVMEPLRAVGIERFSARVAEILGRPLAELQQNGMTPGETAKVLQEFGFRNRGFFATLGKESTLQAALQDPHNGGAMLGGTREHAMTIIGYEAAPDGSWRYFVKDSGPSARGSVRVYSFEQLKASGFEVMSLGEARPPDAAAMLKRAGLTADGGSARPQTGAERPTAQAPPSGAPKRGDPAKAWTQQRLAAEIAADAQRLGRAPKQITPEWVAPEYHPRRRSTDPNVLFPGDAVSVERVQPGRRYNYVLLADGSAVLAEVVKGNRREIGVKHAQLADGNAVVFAGEVMRAEDGRLRMNLDSGTFGHANPERTALDPRWQPNQQNLSLLRKYGEAIFGEPVEAYDHRAPRQQAAAQPAPPPPVKPPRAAPPRLPEGGYALQRAQPEAFDLAASGPLRLRIGDSALTVRAEGGRLVVTDPGGATHAVVEGASLSIGRAPGSDIVLGDGRVSRSHLRLTHRGGKLVLEDLGSTHGTRVEPVAALAADAPPERMILPAPLSAPGSPSLLGKQHTYTVNVARSGPVRLTLAGARVIEVRPYSGHGARWAVFDVTSGETRPIADRSTLMVGREPGPGGLKIDQPSVSRSHLRIFAFGEQVWLDDLSTHGTTIERAGN